MQAKHGSLFLARNHFQRLIDVLVGEGYRCIGPTIKEGAIVYDLLDDVAQLPRGVRDHQSPGVYSLQVDADPRWFSWANGPQALKPELFSPRTVMWRVVRDETGLVFQPVQPKQESTAVIGVRACDLAALKLQDRHFLEGSYSDPHYQARREALFLVAVNCTSPAETCFCASTGDGPRATSGYDLVLSEVEEGFLIEAGSARAEQILAALPTAPVTPAQEAVAAETIEQAARSQTRVLDVDGIRKDIQTVLNDSIRDDSIWEDVSEHCLSCGNCTSVCPTCFCFSESDDGGLQLDESEHIRQWDSCFTQGHSYIHGLTVRSDTKQRYRQWIVHKLDTWHDQYGSSGCVGCGRCISWCPVGIDITAVAKKITAGKLS